jgi:hypothetical protein
MNNVQTLQVSVKKYKMTFDPYTFSIRTPASTALRITGRGMAGAPDQELHVNVVGNMATLENAMHIMSLYLQEGENDTSRIEFAQKNPGDPEVPFWIAMLEVPHEVVGAILSLLRGELKVSPPKKIRQIKTRKNKNKNNRNNRTNQNQQQSHIV